MPSDGVGTALFHDQGQSEVPDAAMLRSFVENSGRTLDQKRLESAAAAHRALRPYVEKMRQVSLSYLWAIEPGQVFEWIEQGGTSAAGVVAEPSSGMNV